MNTLSPPSKRIKLDPSPSSNDENPKEVDNLEREHCTICLQPFLDRTIIPVCAHEFCFECILLWSEQSRKCPLCSRSFDNSYLIHHIRSQYDYQKHYLLPLRQSPSPPRTTESRANALRNTRRERQWGRRQRQQREEADQLERAISRRRWIYQHHFYAKHIASNPYTRYRPFPTPAQFAASPDLISRMTIFLRRELRVWPNLDVEFLTTYTISLMKSIDIRSESAVKLLSEFLDLDTPYTAGERHVNAEHFAHEIYSYLRSPYRDLNTYDQAAQYDTVSEISPPQEIERGRRWSTEPSPSRRSRSQSDSRYLSPIPHRENNAIRSRATRHGTDSSAGSRREDRPSRRHSRDQSPRSIPSDREDNDSRNHPSGRRHSPLDGVQVTLRNGYSHPGGMSYGKASSSVVLAENQDNNIPVQSHFPGNEKEKSQVREEMEKFVAAAAAQKMRVSAPQSGDSAAALVAGEASVAGLINEPPGHDYVDKVRGGSSANAQPSRKRSAGMSVHVHPRNRTLSESVQAYLSRPPQHPTRKPTVSRNEQPTRASDTSMTGSRSLLLRLTDGRTDSDLPSSGSASNADLSTHSNSTSEQLHQGCRSQHVPSLNWYYSTVAEHTDAITQCGYRVDDRTTRSCHFLPTTDDEPSGVSPSGDRSPGRMRFPPSVKPVTRNTNDIALEGSLVDLRPESAQTRHGELLGQERRYHMEMGTARGTGDQARPGDDETTNDDALDLGSDSPGRWALVGGTTTPASLDDHAHNYEHKHVQDHDRGCTNKDTWPGVVVSAGIIAAEPSFFHGDKRAACEDDASRDRSTFGSGSGSRSGSVSTTSTPAFASTQSSRSMSTDTDTLELETRLRVRARLRVRIAAMKGTGSVVGSVGSLPSGSRSGLRMELGFSPGRGRQGTRDDPTVRRVYDRMRVSKVGVAISGDRDRGGDGPDRVHGDEEGGAIRDKDKDKAEDTDTDTDKVEPLKSGSDRDQERQREVALKGMLMLRERTARRG